MEGFKDKIIYSAVGASSGLTGLVLLSRCSGAACLSCFGCAGAGIGILTLALIQRLKGGRTNNGMA